MRTRSAATAIIAAAIVVVTDMPAQATQKFGPLELSGNLPSTEFVRHPALKLTYQF